MAKRDDDDFDDDLEAEEVAEEADDVAEEAAEEAEEAAEADEDDADEDDADEADEYEEADEDAEDFDEEEPYEEEPEKPRLKPKVTALTLVLCALNVFAALGFLYLLMLDFQKRQAYTFAAVQHELRIVGGGTNEDRQGATAGLEAQPRPKISHEALTSAARARGASPTTVFTPVEDGLRYRLYETAPELLKEEMKDLGEPVATIEEEMERLQRKLPGDLQDVVKKQTERMQKATDADKQQKIAKLLYPLCRNPMQVEKLDANIKRAQGAAALDRMLADAVERRILADILLPFEMFRSSATDDVTLEKAADAGDVPIEKLRELMNRRLAAAAKDTHDGAVHFGKEWDGQKRWTIEKRQNAAFLLVNLAYARNHLTPLAKEESPFVYPRGLERAQRISGLYDFSAAAKAYNDALRQWEERVLAAIALDRDGFFILTKNNEIKRSDSFADKHAALQFRIRQVQSQIRQAEARIQDIDQQIERAKTLVTVRAKDLAEVENRIKQERAVTKKRIAELRQLQEQLFENQKILATAEEINARLLERIRTKSGVKGTEP